MENIEKQELNDQVLDEVCGGVWRTVETGVPGLDAILHAEAKKAAG